MRFRSARAAGRKSPREELACRRLPPPSAGRRVEMQVVEAGYADLQAAVSGQGAELLLGPSGECRFRFASVLHGTLHRFGGRPQCAPAHELERKPSCWCLMLAGKEIRRPVAALTTLEVPDDESNNLQTRVARHLQCMAAPPPDGGPDEFGPPSRYGETAAVGRDRSCVPQAPQPVGRRWRRNGQIPEATPIALRGKIASFQCAAGAPIAGRVLP